MVVVDDTIPCLGPDLGPSFSKANGEELWVMLLEKAYAKIYGSYEKINNGMSGKAINDLTGAPYENLDITPKTALKAWAKLQDGKKRNYIMTCASKEGKVGEMDKNGIIKSHCYAILDCVDYVKGLKLLKLRNPWGFTNNAGGAWSNESKKWTPKVLKKLKHEIKDDGVFWISLGDFIKSFTGIEISRCNANYSYTSHSFPDKGEKEKCSTELIRMTVDKSSHIYIGVNQRDKRYYYHKDKENKYKYSIIRMIVGRLDENGDIMYITCAATGVYKRNCFAEGFFDEGKYLITVQIIWD